MENLDHKEFAIYLSYIAKDFRESGMDATAEDYEEASKRINNLLDSDRAYKVTYQQIEDNISTALEQGSWYWCNSADVWRGASSIYNNKDTFQAIAMGAPFTIQHGDAGEIKQVQNNSCRLRKTLDILSNEYPEAFEQILNDTGDANTGDIFFQVLCFSEVIYG
tara:strand:+ start:351 stop:842 length:492 start_codon:yes stop_codon:yes gene_type:complete